MILKREVIQRKNFTETKEQKTFRGKVINRSYLTLPNKTNCFADIDHDAKLLYIYSHKNADAIEEIKAIYKGYNEAEFIDAIGLPF